MEKRKELKVLGWTSYDRDDFVGNESGILGYGGTDYEDEVIAADIKEHGYFFTGDDHQEEDFCTPVLSDYRMIRFSTRHFGAVMAKAQGDDPKTSYSVYAWNFGWEKAKRVKPTGEMTFKREKMPPSSFGITDELFALIKENKSVFDVESDNEDFFEGLDLDNELYLIPFKPKDDEYYWLGDDIYLTFGNKTVTTKVRKILAYNNYSAFCEDIAERNKRDLYRYVYDEKYVKAVAGDGPFVVLAVSAMMIIPAAG